MKYVGIAHLATRKGFGRRSQMPVIPNTAHGKDNSGTYRSRKSAVHVGREKERRES